MFPILLPSMQMSIILASIGWWWKLWCRLFDIFNTLSNIQGEGILFTMVTFDRVRKIIHTAGSPTHINLILVTLGHRYPEHQWTFPSLQHPSTKLETYFKFIWMICQLHALHWCNNISGSICRYHYVRHCFCLSSSTSWCFLKTCRAPQSQSP